MDWDKIKKGAAAALRGVVAVAELLQPRVIVVERRPSVLDWFSPQPIVVVEERPTIVVVRRLG